MITKWVTVISWKNGIAQVVYNMKDSCNSCISYIRCHSICALNNFDKNQTIKVESEQPLLVGQKIKIGITEKKLLLSAMILYLFPLFGLFIFGGLFQLLFRTNLSVLCGFLLGSISVFLLIHYFLHKHITRKVWKSAVIILNIKNPTC